MTAQQNPMRMMMILPMMFFMNKIDFEDPTILWGARCCFFLCQIISLALAVYVKNIVETKNDETKIFVAEPKSPFDTSSENSTFKQTTYFEHEQAKAKEFLNQTLIGAGISTFIHLKFGVNQVVVMQSVMIPMNLYDNALLKKYVFKTGGPRYWEERLEGESLNAPIAATASASAAPAATASKDKKGGKDVASAVDAIAQTWDAGADADFDALLKAVLPKGVNATTADGWTALMVACGSPVDTEDAIKKLVKGGASVRAVDNDGWTALHWCAFHGRPEAAEVLLAAVKPADADFLLQAKDTQGRTAAEVATQEGNADVATVILKNDAGEKSADGGVRRRKAADSEATPIEEVD